MKELVKAVIYQPLYNILIFLAWLIPGHSIGWAIIILTILIRLALLPASLKATKLQVRLQELQPKINKLRSEIKDAKEQNVAIMNLYKEEGVSPMGSCLPTLIQLPILWILYTVFRNGLDASRYSLLYQFTPRPEVVNTHFFGFNLNTPDPWVLPIIAGLLQFALSWLMMKKTNKPKDKSELEAEAKDPMQAMNKQMIFLFPLITIFIGRSFPAALVIYWIITTLFSLGQQIYVMKKMPRQAETKTTAISSKNLPAKNPQNKKRDLLGSIMDKRLTKQAKKAGVSISVRQKGK